MQAGHTHNLLETRQHASGRGGRIDRAGSTDDRLKDADVAVLLSTMSATVPTMRRPACVHTAPYNLSPKYSIVTATKRLLSSANSCLGLLRLDFGPSGISHAYVTSKYELAAHRAIDEDLKAAVC